MDTWLIVLLSILGALLLLLVVLPVILGVTYRIRSRNAPKGVDLKGKTVIVTGPTSGIGLVAAQEIAKTGARLVMACRNLTKAQPIAEQIKKESGNDNIVVRHLDVSDLTSVRKFAEEVNEEEEAIHILINNAGILAPERKKLSPQGFELTLATNHLGPFLLTNLLLDKIKASAPSRIVNVSSLGYALNELNLDDLNYEKKTYGGTKAYCQSKLCNVLFTKKLATMLEGTGVTTNCLHPGYVSTEIFSRNNTSPVSMIASLPPRVLGKTCQQGAQTTLYVALSEECGRKSGHYYDNCKLVKKKAACLAQWTGQIQIEKVGQCSKKDTRPALLSHHCCISGNSSLV
ncbi:Short-chain dehydrogenase/reductase SDR [Trinorchestia longiramus]|nr:Short-chain dehydrogenase/reductase SDR [Trinorchestia longiramus]